jgi:hypothetical protein
MGYDPVKIVREVAQIKSLKKLKNDCNIQESRASKYKEIIPLCEKIVRFGISPGELIAFHAAVMKKVDMENISNRNAAYALMDGIDTSEKLLDTKKQLNDTIMKIQMVNLFSARQNDALNALMKLQLYGVTEEEILNIYGFLNGARLESARSNPFDSYLFNSRNGSNFGAPK